MAEVLPHDQGLLYHIILYNNLFLKKMLFIHMQGEPGQREGQKGDQGYDGFEVASPLPLCY